MKNVIMAILIGGGLFIAIIMVAFMFNKIGVVKAINNADKFISSSISNVVPIEVSEGEDNLTKETDNKTIEHHLDNGSATISAEEADNATIIDNISNAVEVIKDNISTEVEELQSEIKDNASGGYKEKIDAAIIKIKAWFIEKFDKILNKQ